MSQEISFEIHQQFAAQQSTNVVKASIYFPVFTRQMYVRFSFIGYPFRHQLFNFECYLCIFYDIPMLFCLNAREKGGNFKGKDK